MESRTHNLRSLSPQPDVHTQVVQTTRGPVEVLESGQGWPVLYFHGTGAGNDLVPAMEQPLLQDGFRLIVPNR